MRICPISTYNYSQVSSQNFKSSKIANKVAEGVKTVALPTAFALAMMFPASSLNAGETTQFNVEQTSKRSKEDNLPYYLQKDAVQYSKKFEMDGKKYTMYYTDYCQKFTDRKNAVSEIFIVPEDFKLYKDGVSELNAPPKVENIVYHDLEGSGQNFVSVVIQETVCSEDGRNYEQIFREIVLPEKIGQKLIDLCNGKSKYYLLDERDTYMESSSKELMQPIIQRGRVKLSIDK